MSSKKVSIIYNIKDNASKGVNKIKGSVKGLTSSVLSSAVGFAAVSAATIALIKDFADFESAMIDVGNLTNASRDEVNKMSADMIKMSTTVPVSMGDLTDSLFDVVSAGVPAAESIDFLTTAAQLATAGATSTKVAVDGLTSIINAYGLEASEAGAISDKFFAAQQAGKTTIEELSTSVGKVAPLAKSMGVSIDELLASTSALTLGGIKTSEAVTGIRAALSNVLKPSSQAARLAEGLNLQFNAQALSAKGLNGFLRDTIEQTGGNTEALAMLFGSVEAVNTVLALSADNFSAVNEIQEKTQTSIGLTAEAYEEKLNSINEQLAITKNKVLGLSRSIISGLAPAITAVIKLFNKSIDHTNRQFALVKQGGTAVISFFKSIQENAESRIKSMATVQTKHLQNMQKFTEEKNNSLKQNYKSTDSEITKTSTIGLEARKASSSAAEAETTKNLSSELKKRSALESEAARESGYTVEQALLFAKGKLKEESEDREAVYKSAMVGFKDWKLKESAIRDISMKEELDQLAKIRAIKELDHSHRKKLDHKIWTLKAKMRKENLREEELASEDRLKIAEEEAEAVLLAQSNMDDAIKTIVQSGVDSHENAAEAMLKTTLNMVVKQIEAQALAEVAKSSVAGWMSFGATLLFIPGILAASAAAQSAVNSIKLAEGGVISPSSGGTNAIIGEANRSEAVIPLDSKRGREALGGGAPSEIVLNADGVRILAKAIYKSQTSMIRSGQIQRRN